MGGLVSPLATDQLRGTESVQRSHPLGEGAVPEVCGDLSRIAPHEDDLRPEARQDESRLPRECSHAQ